MFERLRQRKIVQWALAYLAGSWLILQVLDVVADVWQVPLGFQQAVQIVLAVGLLAVLVLAWYHGEQGRQRVGGTELMILAGLFAVAGFLVVGLAPGTGAVDGAAGPAERIERDRPAIAVLPIESIAADSTSEIFAAGIHSQIISELSKISALAVTSRASVVGYAADPKPAREIAEDLTVDFVLEGTAQRAQDRVRLTVQLVDARTEENLWGEVFDRALSLEALFAIQDELSRRVAQSLSAEVLPQESDRVGRQGTVSLEAYDFYLQGKHYLSRSGGTTPAPEDGQLALEMFERATLLDPSFPEGYAWASIALEWTGGDREARGDSILAAASRALELDPDGPDGHLAMGMYHYYIQRDFEAALGEFELAEKGLNAEPWLLLAKAFAFARQGQMDAAIEGAARAVRINPRDLLSLDQAGHLYLYGRRYDQGEVHFRNLEALWPEGETELHLAQIALAQDGDPLPLAELRGPYVRWLGAFLKRDFAGARAALGGESEEEPIRSPHYRGFPKAVLEGLTYLHEGATDSAVEAFETAHALLLRRADAQALATGGLSPAGREIHYGIVLGSVLAGLGRTDEAAEEARGSVTALETHNDALEAGWLTLDLAWLYGMIGDDEAAMTQVERYLALPGFWSARAIVLDPRADPLRDNPRFRRLIEGA
jgi:serine/threonine-protein kinase